MKWLVLCESNMTGSVWGALQSEVNSQWSSLGRIWDRKAQRSYSWRGRSAAVIGDVKLKAASPFSRQPWREAGLGLGTDAFESQDLL